MTFEGVAAIAAIIAVVAIVCLIAGAKWMSQHDRDLLAAQPAPIIHNTAIANGGGGSDGIGVGSKIVMGMMAFVIIAASINFFTSQGNKNINAVPVQAVATQAIPQPVPTIQIAAPTRVAPTVVPIEVPQPIMVPAYADNSFLRITAIILVVCIAVVGSGIIALIVYDRNRRKPIIGLPTPSSLALSRRDDDRPIDMGVWGDVVEQAVDDLERP